MRRNRRSIVESVAVQRRHLLPLVQLHQNGFEEGGPCTPLSVCCRFPFFPPISFDLHEAAIVSNRQV